MIRSHLIFVIWRLVAVLCIAGCANLQAVDGPPETRSPAWHGRLAVRTEPNPAMGQLRMQAFSATFELRGNADLGELLLFTPLGSTAAAIRWTQDGAELQTQGTTRQFGNLQQLVLQALGSNVPVSALFMWLQGNAVEADGWHVDLSQSRQGKIMARRDSPEPKAELRLILEQ